MADPWRAILVGVGGFGAGHLAALLKASDAGEAVLAAAVEPFVEKCSGAQELAARGIPLYATLDAAFAAGTEADVVVIASPIACHCGQTLAALAQGAAVYCEKPAAATVQEALAMAEASAVAGRGVAIGYQWSFSDAVQRLKRDIMAGVLGELKRLRTLALWPRRRSYYRRNSWAGAQRSAAGDWVLDSPVNNACAHYLHNSLYVLGPTRERSATPVDVQSELYRANAIDNYDTAALRVRTEGGAEVLFYVAHPVKQHLGPLFCYEFTEATVTYEQDGAQRIVARWSDGRVRDYGNPNAGRPGLLARVAGELAAGQAPACGIEAATPHVLCVDGAQESTVIGDFPRALVTPDGADDPLCRVTGLEADLIQCYARGLLPSEHGALRWAGTAGRVVDLRGYRRFPADDGVVTS